MKKSVLHLFILIIAASITGCASMFSSKLTNIPVKTTPVDASISVFAFAGGKIFEGQTPCIIALKKKEIINGKVVISMAGYKEVEVKLGSEIETSAYANICLLPFWWLGAGIDYLSGTLARPEVRNINIIL